MATTQGSCCSWIETQWWINALLMCHHTNMLFKFVFTRSTLAYAWLDLSMVTNIMFWMCCATYYHTNVSMSWTSNQALTGATNMSWGIFFSAAVPFLITLLTSSGNTSTQTSATLLTPTPAIWAEDDIYGARGVDKQGGIRRWSSPGRISSAG